MKEEDIKQNQNQEDRIEALEKGHKEILALLQPIAENYSAALVLGRWFMGLMLLVGTVISLLIGVKTLLK